MLQKNETSVEIAPGKTVVFETGRLAKQAAGSVLVSLGDTSILCTVCHGKEMDSDFFPLTVEYREKTYAAGKIPGGYFKREARPSEEEILKARLIDRPIRPLFPKGFRKEVQVIATVLSSDDNICSDGMGVAAASLAVGLSDLPFEEQCAAVRVISLDGEFIVNPTFDQIENSDMDLVVSGSETSVVMVEGEAWEVSEKMVIDGIMFAHEAIKKMVAVQNQMIAEFGKAKMEVLPPEVDEELVKKVEELAVPKLKETFHIPMTKRDHYPAMKKLSDEVVEALGEEYAEREGEVRSIFADIERTEMRSQILSEKLRIDGRSPTDIRPIDIDLNIFPRIHGSAVFQRGETQSLATCTLGTKADEQRVDSLQGESFRNYMLHYNFPPFSVGETKRVGSVSRREVGHGHLAQRALAPILPLAEDFPYTIRLVSEILESNGSSSMASVCGGSLALMDAGVPVKCAVSGIAMGLISEGDDVVILSDITGTEDHLGDMDFKVTGTTEGITALQMDIKIKGITPELMSQALEQAKAGRAHILEKMSEKGLENSRPELSASAPVIRSFSIDTEKIRVVIGPGGNTIRGIQSATGADLSIEDDGTVQIAAPNKKSGDLARAMIDELVAEVEVGKTYKGKVKSIVAFGAFVEVLPGRDGLVHISELADHRVEKVEDILAIGDEVMVKCIGMDRGKIKLSKKAVEAESSEA